MEDLMNGITAWSHNVTGLPHDAVWTDLSAFLYEHRLWFWGATAAYPLILCLIFLFVYLFGSLGDMMRPIAFAWNASLALFSMCGAYYVAPYVVDRLITTPTLSETLCDVSWDWKGSPISWWTFLFVCSKIPELGDTFLLAIRGRPVVFLQWYHHMTVCLYCWHAALYQDKVAISIFFAGMNLCVHSVMYSYFAITSLPRSSLSRFLYRFRFLITIAQLTQMGAGMYFAWSVNTCPTHDANNRMLALLMYSSYFLLFAKLFFDSFICPKGPSSESKKPARKRTSKKKKKKTQ